MIYKWEEMRVSFHQLSTALQSLVHIFELHCNNRNKQVYLVGIGHREKVLLECPKLDAEGMHTLQALMQTKNAYCELIDENTGLFLLYAKGSSDSAL